MPPATLDKDRSMAAVDSNPPTIRSWVLTVPAGTDDDTTLTLIEGVPAGCRIIFAKADVIVAHSGGAGTNVLAVGFPTDGNALSGVDLKSTGLTELATAGMVKTTAVRDLQAVVNMTGAVTGAATVVLVVGLVRETY